MRDIVASLSYFIALTPPLTTASLPRHQKIVPAAPAIVGIASMYNPTDPNDRDSGNEETASGERYDANGWTAAIRTDLRAQFGGVRFGKNYRAAFALVQASDKQAIVRINDVGPLRRGRIIDLNERAMRYFDPTLQLGLIGDVKVTPLAGQDWALGPLDDERPVSFASRFDQALR
jgi:rare lipoprotein A